MRLFVIFLTLVSLLLALVVDGQVFQASIDEGSKTIQFSLTDHGVTGQIQMTLKQVSDAGSAFPEHLLQALECVVTTPVPLGCSATSTSLFEWRCAITMPPHDTPLPPSSPVEVVCVYRNDSPIPPAHRMRFDVDVVDENSPNTTSNLHLSTELYSGGLFIAPPTPNNPYQLQVFVYDDNAHNTSIYWFTEDADANVLPFIYDIESSSPSQDTYNSALLMPYTESAVTHIAKFNTKKETPLVFTLYLTYRRPVDGSILDGLNARVYYTTQSQRVQNVNYEFDIQSIETRPMSPGFEFIPADLPEVLTLDAIPTEGGMDWFQLTISTPLDSAHSGMLPQDTLYLQFPLASDAIIPVCQAELLFSDPEYPMQSGPLQRSVDHLDPSPYHLKPFVALFPYSGRLHFNHITSVTLKCQLRRNVDPPQLFGAQPLSDIFSSTKVTIHHECQSSGSELCPTMVMEYQLPPIQTVFQDLSLTVTPWPGQPPSLVISISSPVDEPLEGAVLTIKPMYEHYSTNQGMLGITKCFHIPAFTQHRAISPSQLIGAGTLPSEAVPGLFLEYTITLPTSDPAIIECLLHPLGNQLVTDTFSESVELTPPPALNGYTSLAPLYDIRRSAVQHARTADIILQDHLDNYLTAHKGEVYTFSTLIQFPAASYLLPGDHLVLRGSLFDVADRVRCAVTYTPPDGADEAPISTECLYVRSDPQHALAQHDTLGPHLQCIVLEHDPDTHQSPPRGGGASPGAYFIYSTAPIVMTCDVDMNDHDAYGPQRALTRIETRVDFFSHQLHKTPDVQYRDSSNDAFHLSVSQLLLRTNLQYTVGWVCKYWEDEPNQPKATSYTTVCQSALSTCQLLLRSSPHTCFNHSLCTVEPFCSNRRFSWKMESVPDEDCVERGIYKPYPLGSIVIQECPQCSQPINCADHAGYVNPGPTPVRFTTPSITHINQVATLNLVRTASPASVDYENPMNQYKHYHPRLFYGDRVTVAWTYIGPLDSQLDLFMLSSSTTAPQHLAQGVYVAKVAATAGSHSFSIAHVLSSTDYIAEARDIRFELRTASGLASEPVYDTLNVLVPQLAAQCLVRESGKTTFEGPSVPTCQNHGVCSPSTGTCICFDGFTGDTCEELIEVDPCDELGCIEANTHAHHTDGESSNPGGDGDGDEAICKVLPNDTLVCNCRENEYFGEQCQHAHTCQGHQCVNGRLLSQTGRSDDCQCVCNSEHIGGTACNQCLVQCRNGGTTDTRCTKCLCTPGYIGTQCEIPVWYHTFTLRNLPQHMIDAITGASTTPAAESLAVLRREIVTILLSDYSQALSRTFIIVDDRENGGTTLSDGRIAVKAELARFNVIIPPGDTATPYLYVQLLLYPANMDDAMLEYAQQRGLAVDWTLVTANLDAFQQYLRDEGIIEEGDHGAGILPDIEDPACLLKDCKDAETDPDIDDESNGAGVTCTLFGLMNIPFIWRTCSGCGVLAFMIYSVIILAAVS